MKGTGAIVAAANKEKQYARFQFLISRMLPPGRLGLGIGHNATLQANASSLTLSYVSTDT